MTSGVIIAGLAIAAIGFTGRYAAKSSKVFSEAFQQHLKSLPNAASFANSKYYKGGFEPKMTKRESALVLGVSPSASKIKVKDAHRKIMILNHPDKGGSPYLASKINEAKDLLESNRPSS